LGFLPIGLFYHVIYTLAVAVVMWLIVKYAWPSHLESADAATNPRVNSTREGRTE